MTTYAEKADIAAKAVKVLDSVTMNRHEKVAHKYAELAARRLYTEKRDSHSERVDAVRTSSIPSPTIDRRFLIMDKPLGEMVKKAFDGMKRRLNKPRYTLKDGEWVRKQKEAPRSSWDEPNRRVLEQSHYMMRQKEANALRNLEFAAMAQNMGMAPASYGGGNPYVGCLTYGPHNSLVGSAPYDHRGQ